MVTQTLRCGERAQQSPQPWWPVAERKPETSGAWGCLVEHRGSPPHGVSLFLPALNSSIPYTPAFCFHTFWLLWLY